MQKAYTDLRSVVHPHWSPLDPNRHHTRHQHSDSLDTARLNFTGDTVAKTRLELALSGQSIATREALVFSQGIPVVVSSLLAELFIRATGKGNRYSADVDMATWGQQLLGCGFLFGMESLVSAQGKELSMLLDNAAFIEWLKCCRLKFVPDSTATPPVNNNNNNPFNDPISPRSGTKCENNSTTHPETMPPWTIELDVLDYEREAKPSTCISATAADVEVESELRKAPTADACLPRNGGTPLLDVGRVGLRERLGAVPVEVFVGVPRETLIAMGLLNRHIRIVPVLFTQGINEMQSVANLKSRLKSTPRDVQRDLNIQSMVSVKQYAQRVSLLLANRRANFATGSCAHINMNRYLGSVAGAMTGLERVVASQQNHSKDTDVLTSAEEAIRVLNGGLVTFCKSGKDRTAMAVTLAQARLLLTSDDIPRNFPSTDVTSADGGDGGGGGGGVAAADDDDDDNDVNGSNGMRVKNQVRCVDDSGRNHRAALVGTHAQETALLLEVAGVFREFGCRMVVAEKNIGRPQYSFNTLQRKLLPQLYRPPVSTIQDMITSVVARDS
jgi:hypothetical protein